MLNRINSFITSEDIVSLIPHVEYNENEADQACTITNLDDGMYHLDIPALKICCDFYHHEIEHIIEAGAPDLKQYIMF